MAAKPVSTMRVPFPTLALLCLAAYPAHAVDLRPCSPPAAPRDVRIITATRAARPPVIDGRLDDTCWTAAPAVTHFRGWTNSYGPGYLLDTGLDVEVQSQSVARVCYDDVGLYVGVDCLASADLGGESVEIMVDPGRTMSGHHQFLIGPSGWTAQLLRSGNGFGQDDKWHGAWSSQCQTRPGAYSVEVAIPFDSLAVTPQTGRTWGINICRSRSDPTELSSIAAQGAFNSPRRFAVLKGVNADFSGHVVRLGPPYPSLVPGADTPTARVCMPIVSLARQALELDVAISADGQSGPSVVRLRVPPRGRADLPLDSIPTRPAGAGSTGLYYLAQQAKAQRVTVFAGGRAIANAFVAVDRALQPVRVQVQDPWNAAMRSGKTERVHVRVSLSILQDGDRGSLQVSLHDAGGQPVASREISAPPRELAVEFAARHLPPGAYTVRAAFRDVSGREVAAGSAPATVLPGGRQQIRVLNSLVSELMNAADRGLLDDKTIEFMNPRTGWVFVSATGPVVLRLDDETEPLSGYPPRRSPLEAMRWLPAGQHRLRVEGRPAQVIVRAVPALEYSIYNDHPHIAPHGPYDWDFLQRGSVLANCNVMISDYTRLPEARHIDPWTRAGKSWITTVLNTFIPRGDDVTAEEVREAWAAAIGLNDSRMSGVVVDEFGGGNDRKYEAFREAIQSISASPRYGGRRFSLYVYGTCFPVMFESREFGRAAIAAGGYINLERYLTEQPTPAALRSHVYDTLAAEREMWEAELPGVTRHTTMVLGLLSQPRETANTNPLVDFKVHLDMQMQSLAREGCFFGLGGIQLYTSSYADEETVRWGARLYRHYGIEGQTKLLSDQLGYKHNLDHISNPDFEPGHAGWTLDPAEAGSMDVMSYAGYGYMQSRYWKDGTGDTFLWSRRGANRPNRFRQPVRGLHPGRLYSVKMITGDYQDLVQGRMVHQRHAVSIGVEGADLLPGDRNAFDTEFYGIHPVGPFDVRNTAYWMNYHWRVFRARGSEAELVVSDWADANTPGGPAGQELMYNFIEVQPYYLEE